MKWFAERWREDKGGALALVGLSIVLLMSMAAFGTDLAWFYINSARVQRGADAAALGGVIWLPGSPGTAFSTAQDIALRNGYDKDAADVAVSPALVPGQVNQLQVTIRHEVPTFFLKVIGFQTIHIAATAIAEYIPPLKLGSPDNEFGFSCDPEEFAGCGPAGFWANIHGKWTQSRMGDAYAPYCHDGGAGGDDLGCGDNELYRPEGYLYGIESATPFTLQFTDLAFHNTSGGNPTGDHIRTGDRGCEAWGPSSAPDCGPTMHVSLYAPDPTPLDLSDSTLLCSATVPPQPQGLETDPYSWQTPDGQGCWSQSGAGTYVVQVRHVDPGSQVDRSGLNRYSIRSTAGQIFAMRDFSIYNNTSATTDFHLAEILPFYAGKTFVIELYDPGESPNNGYLQVRGPDGNIWDDGECRVYDRNDTTQPWVLQQTIPLGTDCEELVTPGEYHDRWLKFEIDLPGSYTCNDVPVPSECWWKMNYNYTGGVPNDTTTWRAFIIGNPIHLES